MLAGGCLRLDSQEQRTVEALVGCAYNYTLYRNPSCIIASCGRLHCAIGARCCEIPSHQQRYTDVIHLHTYIHAYVRTYVCTSHKLHLSPVRPLSIQVCLSVWIDGLLLHTGECVLHATVSGDRWPQIKGPTPLQAS